jgi:hypothetical protein
MHMMIAEMIRCLIRVRVVLLGVKEGPKLVRRLRDPHCLILPSKFAQDSRFNLASSERIASSGRGEQLGRILPRGARLIVVPIGAQLLGARKEGEGYLPQWSQ